MPDVFTEYAKNVARAPSFVGADALPDQPPAAYPVRAIAFYLPQFHAIAENDAWWGKGFTEWTNATKALPRYVGHLQPRLPADLGFYDLGDADVLRRQAELVRRSGVYGICIHDYWFSGRKVLEKPLELLLRNPDIDLRFCLNWANESWSRRWDGSENDLLLEQRHHPDDAEGYAHSVLPALRDPRYIRVDGRPLLMVYRPGIIPDAARVFETWREVFRREGIGEAYLAMAQTFGDADPRPLGLDAAVSFPPHNTDIYTRNDRKRLTLLDPAFDGHARSYSWLRARTEQNRATDYRWFPGVCPGWDNEARKPRHGVSFYDAGPEAFEEWLDAAAAVALDAPPAERLVFVNAWNEWAEGAVLEPDRHFGFANLAAVRAVIDRLNGDAPPPQRRAVAPRTTASAANLIRGAPARALRRLRKKLGAEPPADVFDPLAAPAPTGSLKAASFRGSLVTGAGQGAKLVLGIVSQLALARVLFPADFGLLAMAYPVIALVGLLNDIGIGESIIQRKDVDHQQVSTLFWVSVAVSGVLCLVVMAAAPLVAMVYDDPRVTGLLVVMALALPLGAVGGLPASILTRQMRFGAMARIEAGAAAIGLLVTLGCALAGAGYWSLVAGNFAATGFSSVLSWRACRWVPTRLGRWRDAGDHLRFGGHITAANLATFASTSADNVIIGFVNGATALGLYDRSYRLTVQPVTQLLAPISRVALPLLSRYLDEPDQYRAIYLDMVRVVLLATLPVMLFCIVDGRELVDVLLGARWASAGPIFQWIALGGAAAGVNASAVWLFVSQARTASLRRYSMAAAVVHVASFAVGANFGIIYVAAIGASGFVLVTTPMMLFGATRVGSVSFRSVLTACGTFAPPTAIAIVGSHLIERLHLARIVDLLATGGLIGVAFMTFVYLVPAQQRLARRILGELSAMLSRRRARPSAP